MSNVDRVHKAANFDNSLIESIYCNGVLKLLHKYKFGHNQVHNSFSMYQRHYVDVDAFQNRQAYMTEGF